MSVIKTLRYGFALILFLGAMMPTPGWTQGPEDTSFDIGTLTGPRGMLGFTSLPDGKVLVADGTGGIRVRRFLADGQIDTTFGVAGTATAAVFEGRATYGGAVSVDPLGRIYAEGRYLSQYSSPDSVRYEQGSAIARFLPSGAVDASFGTGGVILQEYYHETNPSNPSSPPVIRSTGIPGISFARFSLLPDGKLLVQGAQADSDTFLVLARFDANGQLDASFGGTGVRTLNLGEPLRVGDMKVGHDGSIVMLARNINGTEDVVVKITQQGTLDTNFGNAGTVRVSDNAAYEYYVSDLAIQPDGRLVLGGSRAQKNGDAVESVIARLSANGALDSSFGSGGLSILTVLDGSAIQQLALEMNGKILAAGTTTVQGGSPASRTFLVRTLSDGQVDTGFQQQVLGIDAQASDLQVSDAAYLLIAPASSSGYQLRKFFVDPAPRTGSLTNGQTPSFTDFYVDVLNASGMLVDSATTSHVLGLHGYIYTQPADVGANAEVFVVASTARGLYMRTTSGTFVAWSGRIADLMPAYENVQLSARTYVPIYGGALPFTGPYAVYLGYMTDSGPLVYIEEPVAFQITQ